MLAIELRFPTARYHATPWDRHVNEGVVEWPPCPFRLLRAIVATWHLKARADVDAQAITDLVETLAATKPSYYLPASIAAHTRHYVPIGELKDGSERTTKVFDTFMHVGRDVHVGVIWPSLNLTADQAHTLNLLLERLGYLGRAESWVEATLVSYASAGSDVAPDRANVRPLGPARGVSPDEELVRVLCPMTTREIMAWRTQVFEQKLQQRLADKRLAAKTKGKDPNAQKLTKADRDKLDVTLPKTLMDALEVDTGDLRRWGWNGAPGTHWVDYVRPRDPRSIRSATGRKRDTPLPSVARFALASQVPPRLTSAVSLAERVRSALMSRSDAAPVFSGKDIDGLPLRGNRHCYILPEANGAHGRITHVTLYAEMGFDVRARRALDGLSNVWGRGGHPVQLVLLGVGQPDDFAGTKIEAGQCPMLVKSARWISRTPFVPTRHPKASRRGTPRLDPDGLQIGSPEHDLRRLLRDAGLDPSRVEAVDWTDLSGKRTRWLDFQTVRHSGSGARSSNRGSGFRVEFSRPVQGPIALGYGAHFGLGMFVPE